MQQQRGMNQQNDNCIFSWHDNSYCSLSLLQQAKAPCAKSNSKVGWKLNIIQERAATLQSSDELNN